MPWLLAPHQEGLLFSGKMLLEWGVVVSDASVLLFEDIKKLNAQQRTDVPACFIYAPISNLPMTTKHKLFFFSFYSSQYYFLINSHSIFPPAEVFRELVCACACTHLCASVCLCARVCLCASVCVCAWKSASIKSRLLLNCRTGVDSAIRSHFRERETLRVIMAVNSS